jgi:hypothetical protein
MDLLPHMWAALSLGTVTVAVTFHEPVTLDQLGARKALSQHCWARVSQGVSDALSGHNEPEAPAKAA